MKPYTWRSAILKSGLKPTTRHVLLTLSCYVNDVGQSAYPSTKTLAADTGLSERAVITHLHEASDAGWLKVRKHGFGGQNWSRNEYYPCTPAGFFDTEGAEACSAPSEKALNVATKGTERRSKGTEPNDKKALKDVQSNSPVELSKELSNKYKSDGAVALPSYSPLNALLAMGVDPQIASDWLQVRKGKKAAATKTAIDGVLREIAKAGMEPDAALRICCERGWAGFKQEWLVNGQQQQRQQSAWAQKQEREQAFIDRIQGKSNANRILKDIN
jgi:hypothetical protein